ncbi:hypothetical protein LTR04_001435 [Oleoguttula sp. CCFEE 6159]|nr:hypothetical protein LTR04_001435 [Oleoguttula sp. CCFEE 6159]
MADSDGEYVQGGSDDDADMHMNGVGTSEGTRSKGKGRAAGQSSRRQQRGAQARWEASAQNTWDIQEGADGTITGTLESMLEAQKRKRLLKDTTPLQRGIIRHLLLILDLSSAMTEKDLKPTRYLLTLRDSIQYIREFFDQNPISQLGVIGMRDGLAVRVSDISGNPNDHIAAVRALLTQEPKGVPSLQNALEMARAGLWHTPSHGTREVVIVLGALLTSDPDDIHKTIKSCVRDKIRVGIIGLAARLHICAEICRQTNSGDESSYGVAIDEQHFKELLLATTTPPVVRSTDKKVAPASLLMMGFPSRTVEESPSLCACHGNLTRGGYLCSRCRSKVCSLPATCPACDLTLVLSTHLARSYHHLFPLRNWIEVSWNRARQKGSSQCFGCLSPFPSPGMGGEKNGEEGSGTRSGEKVLTRVEGASESSRYECETCQNHFCIDCDLFCHEVVHNCPGCQSIAHLPGAEMSGVEAA